jgi:hypothetical protein
VIRVFIGYDPREAVAFHVLSASIHRRASRPVAIVPVALSELSDLLWRPRDPLQSTDFSFSRFLVPHLCGYDGWAVFMDCDMLLRDDIQKLWALRDERYAVMCVQHDHRPAETTKFLGAAQTKYEKKNWSSVMLLNTARCRALTPDYVNTASGLALHRFEWLGDDALIGGLPRRWNHLVGYDAPNPDAAIVHFTIGGPYFEEWKNCEFADEWRDECAAMLAAKGSDPVAGTGVYGRLFPAG